MDFLSGERVSGKIEQVKSNGLIVLLKDDIQGFIEKDSLDGWDEEELNPGEKVYVVVKENGDGDYVKLELNQIISEENRFDDDSGPSVKNLNLSSKDDKAKSAEKEKEELLKWFEKAEEKLDELRKNRTDRLDEEFYKE